MMEAESSTCAVPGVMPTGLPPVLVLPAVGPIRETRTRGTIGVDRGPGRYVDRAPWMPVASYRMLDS